MDVIKAFYHTDEETIYVESGFIQITSMALFEERQIQNIIKESQAVMVTVSPEFFVIEKQAFARKPKNYTTTLNPTVFYSLCVLDVFL